MFVVCLLDPEGSVGLARRASMPVSLFMESYISFYGVGKDA